MTRHAMRNAKMRAQNEGRRPVTQKLLQKKPDRPRTNYLECAVTFRTGASREASLRKGIERVICDSAPARRAA
ncbi:hypothetical protein PSAC2689_240056 [Paraburkholderia sacchari]